MATPLLTSTKPGSPDDDVTYNVKENTGNCLRNVDDQFLVEQLESGIDRESVDDVIAALEQGAPVNFLYEVKYIYLRYSLLHVDPNFIKALRSRQ